MAHDYTQEKHHFFDSRTVMGNDALGTPYSGDARGRHQPSRIKEQGKIV